MAHRKCREDKREKILVNQCRAFFFWGGGAIEFLLTKSLQNKDIGISVKIMVQAPLSKQLGEKSFC